MFKSNLRVLLAIKEVTQNEMYQETKILKKRIKELRECKNEYLTNREMELLCTYFKTTLNDIFKHTDIQKD